MQNLHFWTFQVVPLSRQGGVVDLIMGRLRDKSANVRKYAVQFLKVALTGNPYGAKVSPTFYFMPYSTPCKKSCLFTLHALLWVRGVCGAPRVTILALRGSAGVRIQSRYTRNFHLRRQMAKW